jgi:DNA-binding response OmpR family regulator
MDKRILIIEDERALVMALEDRLESEGYRIEAAYDGIEGESKAAQGVYDCILLDVMLPQKDGFQVCKALRDRGLKTPILMLTARDTTIDMVMGLKLGADDYLAKPFDMQVLLARIEALLRRNPSSAAHPSAGRFCFGPFTLDTSRRQLHHNDEPVALNATEYQLLCYLVDHEGTTIAREKLLDEVWGYELMVSSRTVDVHIARLRQKLNEGQIPQYIKTIRRMGYRFENNSKDS